MMKIDLLIHSIRELVTFAETAPGRITREKAGVLYDAAIAVNKGVIVDYGLTDELQGKYKAREEIDASGKLVTPGLIDTHTHMVFAGSREDEFEFKIMGLSYEEILSRGGGIYRTVEATRKASIEELTSKALDTLGEMVKYGASVVEVKGGYGLDSEVELKIMEAAKRASGLTPVHLVLTMQAHVIPREYKSKRREYIEYYVNNILAEAARRRLARYSDVFCDKGAFTPEETRYILQESLRLGYRLRIHADQLSYIGCSKLASELPIDAMDHLDHLPLENIKLLAENGVAAGLTPTSEMAMFSPKTPPVKELLESNIPIALGTDYNPNNMTPNIQHAMDLATYKYRMTPLEALAAATVNAAYSLRLENRGRIARGYRADIVVWRVPNHKWIGYLWGVNKAETVILAGEKVWSKP